MPTSAPTSPPTFASTSSNTRIGVESASASAVLSASITRASSPLDAIFASGKSGCPGFAENENSHELPQSGDGSGRRASPMSRRAFLKPSPRRVFDAASASLRAARERSLVHL